MYVPFDITKIWTKLNSPDDAQKLSLWYLSIWLKASSSLILLLFNSIWTSGRPFTKMVTSYLVLWFPFNSSYWLITCRLFSWMLSLSINLILIEELSSLLKENLDCNWIFSDFCCMLSLGLAIMSLKNPLHSLSENLILFNFSNCSLKFKINAFSSFTLIYWYFCSINWLIKLRSSSASLW